MLRVRMNCQFCCITFLLLVLTTSCFSYIYWDPTLGGQILRWCARIGDIINIALASY